MSWTDTSFHSYIDFHTWCHRNFRTGDNVDYVLYMQAKKNHDDRENIRVEKALKRKQLEQFPIMQQQIQQQQQQIQQQLNQIQQQQLQNQQVPILQQQIQQLQQQIQQLQQQLKGCTNSSTESKST